MRTWAEEERLIENEEAKENWYDQKKKNDKEWNWMK